MLPSAFVLLDTLPLTPNGKVDRQALPAPEGVRPELEAAYVPPRTPIEEMVAGIWADILSLKQVGIYDNFFELGGHSLLATQAISRMRDSFHVAVSLHRFFEAPTVAGLALTISRGQSEMVHPDAVESLLTQLEGYSDEEAQRLLADEM
jgi:hypothetical protein